MAEIATYRCSDRQCRLTVHLSKDFPVWHPETPMKLRTLAVPESMRAHVLRYRSESYCHKCRSVVESHPENICPKCDGDEAHMEQANLLCPQCTRGIFVMLDLKVR